MDLTVIVPCYARERTTRGLLDSLAASTEPFKTIVVDDGSPTPLDRVVADYRNRIDVQYIRLAASRGPAAARNAGMRAATTEFVAFTDNDCVVDRNWSGQLLTSIRRASPLVAGIGGRVLAAGDDLFSRYYSYHKILDPFLLDGRYLYLTTANSVFRRAAVDAVGGFDEDVVRPGGEDPGLCFKLLGRGLRLGYQPGAVVWHEYRTGLWDFVRTFFRYGSGCRSQVERYGTKVAAQNHANEETQVFPFAG